MSDFIAAASQAAWAGLSRVWSCSVMRSMMCNPKIASEHAGLWPAIRRRKKSPHRGGQEKAKTTFRQQCMIQPLWLLVFIGVRVPSLAPFNLNKINDLNYTPGVEGLFWCAPWK
ncbi:MAG: hypothetical protein ABN482_06315 [Corticimicrobacter sp.]|uniref:hypothetical protein n=1 Tax=Corticimicrobacter sp. TaxID=2678536 RepID=UPI0032DAA24C